jgi:hypothetical protein
VRALAAELVGEDSAVRSGVCPFAPVHVVAVVAAVDDHLGGGNVIITIFGEKMAFVLKANVVVQILKKNLAVF